MSQIPSLLHGQPPAASLSILTINLQNYRGDPQGEKPVSLYPVENTYDRELVKLVRDTVRSLPEQPAFIFTQEDWAGLDLTEIDYTVLGSAGKESNEGVKIYATTALLGSYTWEHGTVDMEGAPTRHYVCVQLPSGHRIVNGFFPGGRYEDDAFFLDPTLATNNRQRYVDAILALRPDVIGGDFNACPHKDNEYRRYFNSEYVKELGGGRPKSIKLKGNWLVWRHLPFQILKNRQYRLYFPTSGTAFRAGSDDDSLAVDGFAVLSRHHLLEDVKVILPNIWKRYTDHAPVYMRVHLESLESLSGRHPALAQTPPARSTLARLFGDLRRGLSPPTNREEVAPTSQSRLPGLLFRVTMAQDRESLAQETTPISKDHRTPLPIAYHVYGTRPPWGTDSEWGQPTMYMSWSLSLLQVLKFAQRHYDTYKTLIVACPTSSAKCHDISTIRRARALPGIPPSHRFITKSGREQLEIPVADAREAYLNSGPGYQQVLVHREHVKELLDRNELVLIPLSDIWAEPGLWDFVESWDPYDRNKTWSIISKEDDAIKERLIVRNPVLHQLLETCRRQYVEALLGDRMDTGEV